MDTVSYICDEFAIMRRGRPAKGNAKSEIKLLLDMKPDMDNFLDKQVKPFLQVYGRRYEWSTVRFKLKSDTANHYPIKKLERFGYYIYENESPKYCYLNECREHSENYYIVVIDGEDTGGVSLMQYREGIEYVARLGLLAKDGSYSGLSFESAPIGLGNGRGNYGVRYSFELPINLWFNRDFINLEDAIDSHIMQHPQSFGSVRENGRRTDIEFRMRRGGGTTDEGEHFTEYWDWIKLSDGKPDPEAANRLAASLMLFAVIKNYRFSHSRYIIDADTLLLKKASFSNLMDALAEYVINDDIHQCATCGRPVFGRNLCRNGGCAVRYSENMHKYAASHTCDDTIRAFPYIKRGTIEKYFGEDSRQEKQLANPAH